MNINPITGKVCHGLGGRVSSVDNVAFGRGGVGGWISETEILIRDANDPQGDWPVAVYDTTTNKTRRLIDVSANFMFADGGGHWVTLYVPPPGAQDKRGIWSSSGFRSLDGAALGIGADGTIIYKPQYQSFGPTMARTLEMVSDGQGGQKNVEFKVCDGHANGPQVVGPRQVVFTQDGNGRIETVGLPSCVQVGFAWKARAAFAGGQWWISYFSDQAGIVLHPFGSFEGFSILPKGDGWHSIAAISADTIRMIVSVNEGEQAGDLWGYDINVATREVTRWAHSIEPPFVPVFVEDCRTIVPSVPAALVPNVPHFAWSGVWWANDAAPGNAAIGSPTYKTPRHIGVIEGESTILLTPKERRLGLLVYCAGDDAAVIASLKRGHQFAADNDLVEFVFVDRRVYPFSLVKEHSGSRRVHMPQWYVRANPSLHTETAADFARDVIAQARQFDGELLMPTIRATSPSVVPPSLVVESLNELITQGALNIPGYIGQLFFAWTRGDGPLAIPAIRPAIETWLNVPTTEVSAVDWIAKTFPNEVPKMERHLTPEERATVDAFFAHYPLPQYDGPGDAPESWQDEHLRHAPTGRVFMLAQQMAFSHDKNWGQKRRDGNARISNGTIALLDVNSGDKKFFHAYDLLQGASTGRPKLLGGSGSYYYVDDGQEFVPVPPFDHIGNASKPRTGRAPWPETANHGLSGFDVACRVHGFHVGSQHVPPDFSYYNETAPLPLNVFFYATINHPETHRVNRTFEEGMVQMETLLKRATADNRQMLIVMICGSPNRDGVKPTRAQILDMVRREVELFLRYPKAVLALSFGNELYQQGFEASEMLDPKMWDEVEALIPLQFPFAIGQVGDVVVFGPGNVAMMHPDRGKSSADALQILADAQARVGLKVVAREPKRIEAGGTGQASGDIAFVREELDNAERLKLPYFLHIAAGRGAYVPAMDDVQREALKLIKERAAKGGTVPIPGPGPTPPPGSHPILDVDMRGSSPNRYSDEWYNIIVFKKKEVEALIDQCYRMTHGGRPAADSDISMIVNVRCGPEHRDWVTPRGAMEGNATDPGWGKINL